MTFAAAAGTAGSLAAGAAAVGTLATSSLAGFLTVAGGIASGIGVLTKKKSLMKIGGLMALGGGVMGLAQGAFGSAVDAATTAAGNSATDAAMMDLANSGGGNLGAMGAESAGAAAGNGLTAPVDGAPMWSTQDANALAEVNMGDTSSLYDKVTGADKPGESLYQRAMSSGGAPQQAANPMDPALPGTTKLAEGASSMTQEELAAYLAKQKAGAKGALGSVSDWLRQNKELVQMGGTALASMYGPAAEKMDWEKSLYGRRVGNLNNPIRLTNGVR